MVLGKNGRLLSILSEGSRDRIPVFLSNSFSFQSSRQKKRKSTKGSRNEERRRKRRERREEEERPAGVSGSSRVTRPRGLVCKSGLAIGYAEDEQDDGSLRKRLNGSTP